MHENVLSGDAFFLRLIHFMEDKELIQRNVCPLIEPPELATLRKLRRDRQEDPQQPEPRHGTD